VHAASFDDSSEFVKTEAQKNQFWHRKKEAVAASAAVEGRRDTEEYMGEIAALNFALLGNFADLATIHNARNQAPAVRPPVLSLPHHAIPPGHWRRPLPV
jgi:hypothetical protein